ncbi:hypothetical protein WN48_10408 [Eufriesea mexicana]|nr:hypothetical protein WN48_10408 [Eufriesea mexicana]
MVWRRVPDSTFENTRWIKNGHTVTTYGAHSKTLFRLLLPSRRFLFLPNGGDISESVMRESR